MRYALGAMLGILLFSAISAETGAAIHACQSPNRDCASTRTDTNGDVHAAPITDAVSSDLRFDRDIDSGNHGARSPGSVSAAEGLRTSLTLKSGPTSGLDVAVAIPLQVAGRILQFDGSPSAETTVHACREVPQPSCHTAQSDVDGRFAIDLTEGDYYIAFTIESNERWYYHSASEGHLIGTGRRPERTFVTVPSAEAASINARIPDREFARIVIHDRYRGPRLNATVEVRVCREDWSFESILPQCLVPTETAPPAGADRELRAPTPAEPYYIRFAFSGYAVGGGSRHTLYWYYDEHSATGMSSDWLRRTTFAGGSVPPRPLPVRLPDLPRSLRVRLELNPGVNLVGWPGGEILLTELARQIPELKGVVRFSRNPDDSSQAYPVNGPNPPTITSLSRWWFYVDLDEPRTVFVETAPNPVRLHPYGGYHHWFPSGESLLVWAGAQPVTIEQATAGLGELRLPPRLLRWTGAGLAELETGTVRQGDIIRVDSPLGFQALLPYSWQPFYVLNGPVDREWGQIPHRLQAVQAFFWDRFGFIHNNFTLYYRTSTAPYFLSSALEGRCGWSSAWSITLTCADPHSIARQYFRLLQLQMLSIQALNREPAWLVEGMMEYAAAVYTHHSEGQSGSPLGFYWEDARSGFDDQRELTDLPADIRDWGDDHAATTLSAVAVDWLIKHSGNPDALFEFHRRAFDHALIERWNEGPDDDWLLAFEQTFDISVDDFYQRFAEYRANGFPSDGR